MISATLDSNVFRKIASPDTFSNDPDYPTYRKISDAIAAGKLQGIISDVILSIEAIEKKARVGFYSNYKPKIETSIVTNDGVHFNGRFSIGPDVNAHPGIGDILREHLEDAYKLGIRIRKAPRIGVPTAPNIPEGYFEKIDEKDFHSKNYKFVEAADFIESKGWGLSHIKTLASAAKKNMHWFEALAHLDNHSRVHLAPQAISEWADGDAIAAHIGGGYDYFCTNDLAKKAGNKSVLSPLNREQIIEKYGTVFATPQELLKEIKSI